MRVFVEELVLLEPKRQVNLRDATLTDVLYACGPIHEIVVVFPSRLPRAMHVGKAIRERSIARPSRVWVGAREWIGVVDLGLSVSAGYGEGESLTKLFTDPTMDLLTSQMSSGSV